VEQTARQSREAFVRLLARWIELAHTTTHD
jgi:hypothetical protein